MDDLTLDLGEDGTVIISEGEENEEDVSETQTETANETLEDGSSADYEALIEGSVGFGIFVVGILVGLLVFRTLSGRWHT